MITRKDYNRELVDAALAVLLEIVNVLGEYRNGIALVGGWVPEFLLPDSKEKHVGSIDVDLALDHHVLREPGYQTICDRLVAAGYVQHGEQPFIFYRTFPVGGRNMTVEVDFLAKEYEGSSKRHRTQKIQDIRARKARGCDLVFEMNQEVRISGTRPDGRKDVAMIRIPTIAPFLVMKGMALADRNKEKDSWDIYFCVKNYPGTREELVEECRRHLAHKLVQEGLTHIAMKFASPGHVGPRAVADFEGVTDPQERERLQRDAYERVRYLLENLGLVDSDTGRP
ncbi:MAG TPA: hypothetical protein VMY42_24070 [Thermoguttaceae bacterium]|nr:hypothetical protein [Thermoguttaceae bacterium]